MTSKLVVGYYDAEPSCWQDEQGIPRGIFIDLLTRAAENAGFSIQWDFDAWESLLEKLKTGTITVLPAIVRTPDREQFALFSKHTILLDWGAVLVRQGSPINTILDLQDKKVGYLQNDYWFSGAGSLGLYPRNPSPDP
ncbi:MAG: transporter substrate-binding domain-containing protein [Treponema sp.]|nr:transporter substrate-binding domain-containing protein [Treponema sp.]